ncbi:hypothetical protein GCM10010112_83890 [Actinoplanes lobatus]|uniref:Uncharacterized protein n=1 Tax=Actinoplanes lobatus TaxID=113568 RepID=A0A7W7MI40_9ACTN|nr:hypothetical protein [Actinoplanes lobatus]MBB4751127.1 hypothetical protein [Actinoplanes lobatus]GGN94489.1 hypothetical protein GCM10010112_83890 [Actinoplanes lobatus]GIE44623.1 hypothetical protein Alo02nite_75210 [Actinoplanes lobatus]
MSTHTLIRVDETVDRAAVTELSRRPEAPVSGAPTGPTMAGGPLTILLSAPRPKKAR